MDQNLRNPSCLILSHTHVGPLCTLLMVDWKQAGSHSLFLDGKLAGISDNLAFRESLLSGRYPFEEGRGSFAGAFSKYPLESMQSFFAAPCCCRGTRARAPGGSFIWP